MVGFEQWVLLVWCVLVARALGGWLADGDFGGLVWLCWFWWQRTLGFPVEFDLLWGWYNIHSCAFCLSLLGSLLSSGGFAVVVRFVGVRRVWWFWCLVLVCGFRVFRVGGFAVDLVVGLWYLLWFTVFWCFWVSGFVVGWLDTTSVVMIWLSWLGVICGVVSVLGFGWICG